MSSTRYTKNEFATRPKSANFLSFSKKVAFYDFCGVAPYVNEPKQIGRVCCHRSRVQSASGNDLTLTSSATENAASSLSSGRPGSDSAQEIIKSRQKLGQTEVTEQTKVEQIEIVLLARKKDSLQQLLKKVHTASVTFIKS